MIYIKDKHILLLAFLFLFIGFITLSGSSIFNNISGKATTNTCVDSDKGINYSIYGYVNYRNKNYYDYCRGNNLHEMYCSSNNKLATKSYRCPNKCSNGQCISSSCTPLWQCSNWSSCVSNIQTRSCTDVNNCGNNTNKPIETQSCSTCNSDGTDLNNICRTSCGASSYCNGRYPINKYTLYNSNPYADPNVGNPPNPLISTCTTPGTQTYFDDQCGSNCQPQDRSNMCRYYPDSTCTADPSCNNITAGTNNCDSSCKLTCKLDGELCVLNSQCCGKYCDWPSFKCVSSCTPYWQCTNWSSCVSNIQTRICTDANNCGVTINKPAETQSCVSCTNQCTNGTTQCSNSNGYVTCGDYNNDGCTEWSSILTSCTRCDICSNGQCVNSCLINQVCYNNQCCTPSLLTCLNKICGSWSDGCGNTLNCGTCSSGQTCSNGQCVQCINDNQCSSLNTECKLGTCSSGVCTTTNKADGTSCSSGICSNGQCVCNPNCDWSSIIDKCQATKPNGCGGTCIRTIIKNSLAPNADTNCDGYIDRNELDLYSAKWINNEISRDELGNAIKAWSGGLN